MALSIDEIVGLLETRGDALYGGEAVTQLEHALQCGSLAQASGGSPELITAALLHDLGHLIHDLGEDPAASGKDDVHQYFALPFLRGLFPDAVLEPIRLHVDAKRYLCAVESGYREGLSFASRRSLELQGGVYCPEDAEHFIRKPHARDAVSLRRWDDQSKVKGRATPGLAHFTAIMKSCSL